MQGTLKTIYSLTVLKVQAVDWGRKNAPLSSLMSLCQSIMPMFNFRKSGIWGKRPSAASRGNKGWRSRTEVQQTQRLGARDHCHPETGNPDLFLLSRTALLTLV